MTLGIVFKTLSALQRGFHSFPFGPKPILLKGEKCH